MSISINIPEELYKKALAIANAQHLSVEDVFASAFADQLAALERLRSRAGKGQRENFIAVLDNAPDVEPEEFDRL